MHGTNGVIWLNVVKVLEQAIAEVARLPEADQEQIGHTLTRASGRSTQAKASRSILRTLFGD